MRSRSRWAEPIPISISVKRHLHTFSLIFIDGIDILKDLRRTIETASIKTELSVGSTNEIAVERCDNDLFPNIQSLPFLEVTSSDLNVQFK